MRVLVTGGSGFIGSHVVDKLLDAGHEPRIFDLAPSRRTTRRSEVEHRCSATSPTADALAAAIEGCDAIIHLAAVADVGDVVAEPAQAERINAAGHARRCSRRRATPASEPGGLRQHDLGLQRLRPSAASTRRRRSSRRRAISTRRPSSPASSTASPTRELYDVDYTILRFGIPYGPRARDATVLAAFAPRPSDGEPLTVAGDGSQSRRFVYVEDLAEGVVAGAAPGGREPRLQPRRRRGDDDPRDRRGGSRPRRRHRASSTRPAATGRLRRQGGLERARRSASSAGRAQHPLRRGLSPLPRLAPRPRPSAAARPHPHRRHRRGPRPPGAGARRATSRAEHPGSEVEVVDGLRGDGPAASPASSATAPGSSFNWLPVRCSRSSTSCSPRFAADALAGAARSATCSGARRLLRTIRRPRPGRDRLHLSRARPRCSASCAVRGRLDVPGRLGHHRPRRAAVLGPPRRRPAHGHPPRVDRGGRGDRRAGQRALGAAADRPPEFLEPASRAEARRARSSCPSDGQGRRRLRRRLGHRRPDGRGRGRARGRRAQRSSASPATTSALRASAAARVRRRVRACDCSASPTG